MTGLNLWVEKNFNLENNRETFNRLTKRYKEKYD